MTRSRPDDDTPRDSSERAPTDGATISPDDGAGSAVGSARARARVYGLLAAAFDGETATLADALAAGAFADVAEALPVGIETEPLTRTDLDADALAVGYDNLFVVPGPHYVPPFASAHADDPSESFESDSPYHEAGDAGELFGDPAAEAARLYTAAGFDPERGDGIPDHLAASCEFMRALCEREASLLAADAADELGAVRDTQRETLSRLGWLDAFHEAVAREDRAEGVFASLARLARSFAAWDTRHGVAGGES